MSTLAKVYAQALYGIAREEGLDEAVLQQMTVLDESFRSEPEYIRLLSAVNLPKVERCDILDRDFRGKVEQCLLNFMKILTEKGYMRHFSACRREFCRLYNEDHGILEVKAVSAVALTQQQCQRLSQKLTAITGKTIALENCVDPRCLGGVRLDYDGKRVDDTVQHRLEAVGTLLSETVL